MRAALSPSSIPDTVIRITSEDLARLRALVDRHLEGPLAHLAELLDFELERAQVLPQHEMPPDVVTMRSRVVFEDVESGRRREAVLVYPDEADVTQGRISVLAPVGMALLGVGAGHCIRWPMPGGLTRTFRVVSVLYQPEAAGDLHL